MLFFTERIWQSRSGFPSASTAVEREFNDRFDIEENRLNCTPRLCFLSARRWHERADGVLWPRFARSWPEPFIWHDTAASYYQFAVNSAARKSRLPNAIYTGGYYYFLSPMRATLSIYRWMCCILIYIYECCVNIYYTPNNYNSSSREHIATLMRSDMREPKTMLIQPLHLSICTLALFFISLSCFAFVYIYTHFVSLDCQALNWRSSIKHAVRFWQNTRDCGGPRCILLTVHCTFWGKTVRKKFEEKLTAVTSAITVTCTMMQLLQI